MEKSLDFEIELALITEPAENRRNMTQRYNPTTMGSAKSYPGLPDSWTSYVGGLLSIGGVDIGEGDFRPNGGEASEIGACGEAEARAGEVCGGVRAGGWREGESTG